MLVAAAADGGAARHVTLHASAVAEAVAEGDASSVAAAPAAPAPHVRFAADRQDVVLHEKLVLHPATLSSVWLALKDGVALPMLAACAAAAGLPPPAGLASLPTELKARVLTCLVPLELAALACTCTEFRYMAASDAVWEPLFRAHFPSPPVFIEEQAARRGFKWAFGHCWAERRRREEDLARSRRRRFAPAVPHFGPRPPFYPPHAPPGFPGIIGGDQDRLPFLGPTGIHGGGLPGMFGLSGSGASGGGARRQGGPPFRLH